MNPEMTRQDDSLVPFVAPDRASRRPHPQDAVHAQVVDVILADCFLSIGQAIGLRASFEYDAVVWVRNHFRTKFLTAMRHQGNRWLEDRATVTAVCGLLGERAVRYANGSGVIDIDAAMKASADVERYCRAHASRRSAANGRTSEGATALIAGYWCTWDPEP